MGRADGMILLAILGACAACARAQTSPITNQTDLQATLARAGDALTEGRFADAAAGFRAALAGHPNLAEALFGLGVASGQLGHFDDATQALERYVSLRPNVADGHSALATVLLSEGRMDRAKSEFECALRLEPGDLDAAKALARLALAESDPTRAATLLKPLASAPDFDDEARLLLAAAYAHGIDPRAALPLLSTLLQRGPTPKPEVFVTAAIAGVRAADAAFAERACAAGLRAYLNSDDIEQRCLPIVSMEFVKDLEASLHGAPEDFETLIILGRLMTDVVESADSPVREQGLGFLQRAVALRPSDPGSLYNLGRCLRVLARPGAAIPPLQRALAAQPDVELQVHILTQLALSEQQLEHDDKAETFFREAMDRNRALPRHLPSLAFEYYRLLRTEAEEAPDARDKEVQAAAIRDEILRWDAGFLPARIERAKALAAAGRLAEAVAEAEADARSEDPSNMSLMRQAHLLLLRTYTELGRKEDASRHLAWLNRTRSAK